MISHSEPLILAIETATRAGSVSLARGMRPLAAVCGDASSSHSSELIESIERVLREAKIELGSVDVFAAASGPGSFTGLRIGLATVKALAMSIKRKCIGVSTLAAIALAAGNSDRTVASLPAGRGEVFAQMFAVRDAEVLPLDNASHVSPQMLLARYGEHQSLRWAGEGAHLHLQMLQSAGSRGIEMNGDASTRGWSIAPIEDRLAVAVADLAAREWSAGKAIEPHNLQAIYLRASDAEINANA